MLLNPRVAVFVLLCHFGPAFGSRPRVDPKFLLCKERKFGTKNAKSETIQVTTFILENTMILGRKIRNPRLNSKKDLFLENTLIWGQKLVYVLEPHTIFCPTHKVLHVNCMTSLRGHKFSSFIMLAITSIKNIGSPQLYSRFPLNIWVATKKD